MGKQHDMVHRYLAYEKLNDVPARGVRISNVPNTDSGAAVGRLSAADPNTFNVDVEAAFDAFFEPGSLATRLAIGASP